MAGLGEDLTVRAGQFSIAHLKQRNGGGELTGWKPRTPQPASSPSQIFSKPGIAPLFMPSRPVRISRTKNQLFPASFDSEESPSDASRGEDEVGDDGPSEDGVSTGRG